MKSIVFLLSLLATLTLAQQSPKRPTSNAPSATVANAKKCLSDKECQQGQRCKWNMCLNYMNLGFEGNSVSTGFPKKWKIVKDVYGKANRKFVKDKVNATEVACELTFPQGSRNPKASNLPTGGTGVYAKPLDLSKAKYVIMEYQVLFPTGFDFVKGGKLPGLYGGREGCSGGDAAKDCFSTRFMFREKALGESYLYLDRSAQTPDFCSIVPKSHCNDKFGASIGRGLVKFTPGKWTKLRQELKLNTFTNGKANPDGELAVYVNSRKVPVFKHSKIVFRTRPTIQASGIQFESFFGGSKPGFETPKTQKALFKAFKLAYY